MSLFYIIFTYMLICIYFDFHIRKILFHVLIFNILLENRSIDNFSFTNKMRNTPISHCQ